MTLADLLAEHGIRGVNTDPEAKNRLICPRCHGGDHPKDKTLWVAIHRDERGFTLQCKRMNCAGQVAEHYRLPREEAAKPAPKRQPPKPAKLDEPESKRCDAWAYHEMFDPRCIGGTTVRYFGVYTVPERTFQHGTFPAVVFPYRWRGQTYLRKYRPRWAKRPQSQDVTGTPVVFNADALDAAAQGDGVLRIVEGEPDVLGMHEGGYPNTISFSNGTGDNLDALKTHEAEFAKLTRIYLAGDMDEAGMKFREELARVLGRDRCWLVTWPDGCKDACDVLTQFEDGPAAIKAAIDAAQPYPIDGVQEIDPEEALAWRSRRPEATLTTGCYESDRILKLPSDGKVIIVTGYTNHGKTAWTRFIVVHTLLNHGRRWAVFSPEHQPWHRFALACTATVVGKRVRPDPDSPGKPVMSDDEARPVLQTLREGIWLINKNAAKEPPTVEWLLERARALVRRHRITDLLIDPWNELEHARGDVPEFEYAGRMIQLLRAFCDNHGCNVWMVHHPAKPPTMPGRRGQDAPDVYAMSGSAHFANKPDLAIVVHSPRRGETELNIGKSRYAELWGHRGAECRLAYDSDTGRFTDLAQRARADYPHQQHVED